MKSNNDAKENILKGINRKLKIRAIKISAISIVTCLLIVIILYFIFWVKQVPISADIFKNVSIETKLETINELDSKELMYNHLVYNINRNIFYGDMHFYVENNDKNNISSLYFYMSENYVQKLKNKNLGTHFPLEEVNVSILLYPDLCNTDKINEITKVYYLIYNYNNFKQEEFNKIKSEAVLLWQK